MIHARSNPKAGVAYRRFRHARDCIGPAVGSLGWTLRLTDIRPFAEPLPPNASFIRADLADGPAILRMVEGCGTVLHFGGISVEQPFEDVYGPNIRGLYHAFEAARREGARMVFASSNHTIGFHSRSAVLDGDCAFRPDGYYRLSKVYGEMMAQLYWDKHGIETVSLRIGSARAEPTDARMLATWLSYPDLIDLVVRAATAEKVGHSVVWGASNNTRMTWWRNDARQMLGWAPQDNAEAWAGALEGLVGDQPASETNQGGSYCAMGVVARTDRADAITLTLFFVQATRTKFGRPRSSMRFRARTATATSVARRLSLRERSLSPITCLKRATAVSTRARLL